SILLGMIRILVYALKAFSKYKFFDTRQVLQRFCLRYCGSEFENHSLDVLKIEGSPEILYRTS
ncbi:hypothetical protein, partial [Acetivibrio ethanolgignens]|uniref:hypothetical protein n=1 Tax=Acetivibrio ethanolgignens TaxID=290052 RepID=UPI001A9A59F6